MANNLDLSPDGQLAFALSGLRGMEHSGPVANGHHLVPGIFFSTDPESDNMVEVQSRPGSLMTMRFGVDKPGRWLSLNMGLGSADLTDAQILGFAARLDAPVTTTARICIRSGVEGGHRDVFFAKTLVAYPKTSLHLDVMELDKQPDIPRQAPWRELIIFFSRENAEITLHDFRPIFV